MQKSLWLQDCTSTDYMPACPCKPTRLSNSHLQDFGLRRITNQHLDVQSPYNTYLNAGLPPGPIRIPSPKGLDSVLNYVKHNYIYMCAKEDFSGTHNFASNYADHMVNARKYWKALNERKIFK